MSGSMMVPDIIATIHYMRNGMECTVNGIGGSMYSAYGDAVTKLPDGARIIKTEYRKDNE